MELSNKGGLFSETLHPGRRGREVSTFLLTNTALPDHYFWGLSHKSQLFSDVIPYLSLLLPSTILPVASQPLTEVSCPELPIFLSTPSPAITPGDLSVMCKSSPTSQPHGYLTLPLATFTPRGFSPCLKARPWPLTTWNYKFNLEHTHNPTLTAATSHSGIHIYYYYSWLSDIIWTSRSLIFQSLIYQLLLLSSLHSST